MKKSNILQLNNAFIQSERQKDQHFHEERQRKNRFMGAILVLVIFLFILPTYNLVQSYGKLQENEKKLVELETRYEELVDVEKQESQLVTKLKDEDYAAKYVRAKYQYSKEGEFVYNIPGLPND
ncbi:TPA: septum formation initiator family protein [Streptococcus suis]|uniref:Septum formation initiator family protein n=2 Tax=Streptococcus TaxID=1301 RepID=A0A6L8MWZ8_STRSU|nr:septum formation initiator family protein [Streptococcus parasuis]MBY4972058.1 septum formation initiator family protein [Streptococcus suis]MYN69642.1 septum formation initiator family protein [Streptococcus suis]NQM30309.1 septum formation initiator family protein [Streptococcus suis]BCP58693.1 septum formation initiation protein [Streptococcus parasuis]BCP60822.1 septum formation initiation protein [Streptococcus parasuis]